MYTRSSFFSVGIVALLSAASLPTSGAFTLPSHGTTSTTCRGRRCTDTSLWSSAVDVESTAAVNGEASDTKKKRMAILLCPAQFCVPRDYSELLYTIQSDHIDVEVVATRVAPLPRTEWIKVAKQLPTKDFIDANLSVPVTLDWYFNAIEDGLAELFAEGGDDMEVCLLGHSIGGWVARAYLGGLSG